MRRFAKNSRHGTGRRSYCGGFTLTEVALTMVIVGMGILGVVQLLAVCTRQNQAATNATTAMLLANNVQEAIAGLPFSDPSGSATFGLEETGQPVSLWDDVDDFNGYLGSPPIDANRVAIADLAAYSQQVTVERVDPQRLSLSVAGADAARVTVRVLYRRSDGTQSELHRITWIRVPT